MNVLLCPLSDPGFLYSAIAIGRELSRRGHAVHVLCRPDLAVTVGEARLDVMAADAYGNPDAFSVARSGMLGAAQFHAVLRAAREATADVLITSIICHGALLAGERLDIPAVVLGLATYPWPYRTETGECRELARSRRERRDEKLRHYHTVRELVGMPPRRDEHPEEPLLGYRLLLRGDHVLEQPRGILPDTVTHIGPCAWEPRPDPGELAEIRLAVERVGKSLIYVHLGRTFGGDSLWPRLNATFTGGRFQAIVECGRSGRPHPEPEADLIVVRKRWMDPLVSMACAVLTNGTSAPVLGALRQARAIVIAPNGGEQPFVADACVRNGVAVPFSGPADGTRLLQTASDDSTLHASVRSLRSRLLRSGGATAAAEIVLDAVSAWPFSWLS